MNPTNQTNTVKAKKPNVFVKAWNGFKPVIPYIKLQTKLAFSPAKPQSKKRKIVYWIIKAAVYALILFLVFLFIKNLTKQSDIIRGNNFLILFVTLVQLILLIYSISIQVKRLYKPADLSIISTFPLSSFQRYLGEIITIYIRLFFYSFILFYPFLLVYGGAAQIGSVADPTCYLVKYPAQFIFSGLFATILIPFFPFALSLLISVPFMYLTDYLKNKHITKLIIFIIVFAAILVLYALLLSFITEWYVHAKNNKEVLMAIANVLKNLDKWYNPCHWVNQIALFTYIGESFLVYILASLIIGVVGILITKPLYHKFTTLGSTLEGDATVKTIKINSHSPYRAIFYKEVKNILRTPSYAYFYLGVALTMPILTYLTTDLVAKLGEATVGSHVFFGFALLTLCIILSLVGSYAANVISREGKEFYITKITPLSYRKQLLAKASVNFIVSFFGLILCIVVLGCTAIHPGSTKPGLSVGGLFMIFGIATFFLIGITFNGVNLDLARPKIDLLGGQPNESNIIIQLAIGLVVATILSVTAIVGDALFRSSQTIILQVIVLSLAIVYALVNFLVFFFTCEKKYVNMEIK